MLYRADLLDYRGVGMVDFEMTEVQRYRVPEGRFVDMVLASDYDALAAENARLREALREIAALGDDYANQPPCYEHRLARAALGDEPSAT